MLIDVKNDNYNLAPRKINGGGGRKSEVDERIMRNHEQYTYKTLFCIIINIHMGDATGCNIKIWSISYICWLLLNLFFFICMYIIMKDGLTYSETQWTAVYICYIYLTIFANGFSLPGKKKFKVTNVEEDSNAAKQNVKKGDKLKIQINGKDISKYNTKKILRLWEKADKIVLKYWNFH